MKCGVNVMHAKEPDAPDLAKNLRLSMSCHCGNCRFVRKKQGPMRLLPDAARHCAKVAVICNRPHLPCRHRAPAGSPALHRRADMDRKSRILSGNQRSGSAIEPRCSDAIPAGMP